MPAINNHAKIVILLAVLLLAAWWSFGQPGGGGKVMRIVIDDAVIDEADPGAIVQPMWWSVSIYDGQSVYERDLQKFSTPQRYLLAILWYDAEVNNGGHHQFYLNPTGIVWRDALHGFRAIGSDENAKILQASADVLGGSPSLDREVRSRQLKPFGVEAFDAIDRRCYDQNYSEKLAQYIKANRSAFYFNGEVRKP